MKEVKLLVCIVLVTLSVTGSNAQLSVCGVAPQNTRIVGGDDAAAGAWPWQVSLHRSGRHFCGGSLINDEWVLTAAHCFPSSSTLNLVVYLGRENQDLLNFNEESRTVIQVINHPDYDLQPNDNDVSLLHLSSPVEFSDYIRPVCLAAGGSVFNTGTTCWVTGWGTVATDVSLPFPGHLQEVDVPVVSNAQCDQVYGSITDNMICAGLSEGGKDSCQGDSGGPMVSKNNNSTWVLAGVVSFGRGCALPDIPGVYARVSRYESWINSHITTNQPGFIHFQGNGSQGDGSSSGRAHTLSLSLLLSLLPVLFSLFVLS